MYCVASLTLVLSLANLGPSANDATSVSDCAVSSGTPTSLKPLATVLIATPKA